MRHHRTTTTAALAIAIAAATAGVAGASTVGNSATKRPAGVLANVMNADHVTSTALAAAVAHAVAAPTVHTSRATVAGVREIVLVNAKGFPLYYYKGDTASRSMVTGELAALWPPLLSGAPTAKGVTGRLTVTQTPNGHQVAYKGHFLYTFVEDTPGQVTGQAVQNFFVATPGISAEHSGSVAGSATSSSAYSAYGY